MTEQQDPVKPKSHKTVVISSILVVIGMGLFVYYVLRPMYYLICEWTGITGSTFEVVEARPYEIDYDRPIKIQFLAMNNASMPWAFRPVESEVIVYPGEQTSIFYYAKNTSQRDMVAQAIPSLTPFDATNYFLKTECFCFNSQALAAGEEIDMGLVFQIDPDLPEWVKTISLTYSLFDITESAKLAEQKAAKKADQNNDQVTN
jgi:cytochrome c oxidase assembly protein subunit 11